MGEINSASLKKPSASLLYDPEKINWKARTRAFELMMVPDEAPEEPPRKMGKLEACFVVALAGISAMLLGVTVIRLIG